MPFSDEYTQYLQQLAEQQRTQLEMQRKMRLAQLMAQLTGVQSQVGLETAGLQRQLGEVRAELPVTEAELRRQGAQGRDLMVAGMGSRGLAFSGVRLGGESQAQRSLLAALGGARRASQSQVGALERALLGVRQGGATQSAILEAERQGLLSPLAPQTYFPGSQATSPLAPYASPKKRKTGPPTPAGGWAPWTSPTKRY